MSKANSEDVSGRERRGGGIGAAPSRPGMSPYATGGGGVTFERKVAVQYLAHLLVGDGASELGDGRRVVSVAFQQAPVHPVDDLVVSAACPDELHPSLVLTIAVRRSPNLVVSDESSQDLIRQFVRAVIDAPTEEPETRLGLVVAGPQGHAEQLAKLAHLAAVQMDAPGFFDLVRPPVRFDAAVPRRLEQLQKLVEHALHELGDVEAGTALVESRTWQLLSRLTVLTGAGHRLRILLRERLVEACAAGDRRLAEEREAADAARAARTPEEVEQERQFLERHSVLFSEIGYGGRRPRQRPEMPREITDEVTLELLALLGPDLGDDGEVILRRVAEDAPSLLAPAVEELFTGRALASRRRGLLAELTEAYYLDDEIDDFGFHAEGIRRHQARSVGIVPHAAWYRGPFMSLFQSDFRNGVGILNRLLNHAARIRAGTLVRLDQGEKPLVSGTLGPLLMATQRRRKVANTRYGG